MSNQSDLAKSAAGFNGDPLSIDTANNRVGVGTASPSNPFQVGTSDLIVDSSGNLLVGTTTSSSNDFSVQMNGSGGRISAATGTNSNSFRFANTNTTSEWSFGTNSPGIANAGDYMAIGRLPSGGSWAEAMRIDSSGKLLVGRTGPDGSTLLQVNAGAGGNYGIGVASGTASTVYVLEFRNSNGVVGSITTASSATAYNTSSDYRLKEDVQPMVGASDRVLALNPVNFAWKVDGSRVDGFLAHEAQAVVPEAVTGTQDAMRDEEYEVTPAVLDEDGNEVTPAVMGTRSVPDYQGIDQSKLVPLLTAALKEAITKIETLETEMTSVKARLDALEGN